MRMKIQSYQNLADGCFSNFQRSIYSTKIPILETNCLNAMASALHLETKTKEQIKFKLKRIKEIIKQKKNLKNQLNESSLKRSIQAYLRDIAGSVPEYCNKVNISEK